MMTQLAEAINVRLVDALPFHNLPAFKPLLSRRALLCCVINCRSTIIDLPLSQNSRLFSVRP
jgi:hypothetical protein